MLQMFVAVINENFDIAEEAKKGRQTANYLESQKKARQAKYRWWRNLNPYRWIKANPVSVKVENLPQNLVLPMQKSLVRDYDRASVMSGVSGAAGSRGGWRGGRAVFGEGDAGSSKAGGGGRHKQSKSLTALQALFSGENGDDVQMEILRGGKKQEINEQDMEDPVRQL